MSDACETVHGLDDTLRVLEEKRRQHHQDCHAWHEGSYCRECVHADADWNTVSRAKALAADCQEWRVCRFPLIKDLFEDAYTAYAGAAAIAKIPPGCIDKRIAALRARFVVLLGEVKP